MIARIKLWLEGAAIPYKDVKVLRGNATFAFTCFNSESERDAALASMTSSIAMGAGVWADREARKNRPRRPNNRPEQTPVERLMHQARNKVRYATMWQNAGIRISMNWHRSAHSVTNMKTCEITVLGKVLFH